MSTPGGAGQLVLIRHAQTEWSISGRHTGSSDIPLTDAGRAAARELVEPLSIWRFGRVLVSPLRRARETADLCGLGASAEVMEELREWDYGEYEGLTTAEIRAERPDWSLWRDGCPGGESPAAVGARADRVLAALAAGPDPVAAFSHGHILRVVGARWIELEPAGGGRLDLSAGAISVLGYERSTRVLERWNDAGAGTWRP